MSSRIEVPRSGDLIPGKSGLRRSFLSGRLASRWRGHTLAFLAGSCLLFASSRVHAAPADSALAGADLTQVRLEDLMSLEVTSVSRREQPLSEIAAAVTVIGPDQIRASGATTLSEILRLVPGLQVAQINANMWSISARGFSGRIANKLLLLIDGRTVYSPVFSGVYWDEQDLMLRDIERIEVIRGPGASVWGANAVNGVINVITRDAHDTQRGILSADSGTEEIGGGTGHWGGALGSSGAYRIFARGSRVGAAAVPDDAGAWDSSRMFHTGFRADGAASSRSQWTVTGDLRSSNSGQSIHVPMESPPYSEQIEFRSRSAGGNLVANWRRTFSPHSDLTTQGYVDVADRNDEEQSSHVETYDLEMRHHVYSDRHDLVWGLGGRMVRDRLEATTILAFDPDRKTRRLVSAFAQDEIALAHRKVRLTLGVKLEDELEKSGTRHYDLQPTARALWAPDARQSLWAAVSRALRTPSRAEQDLRYHVATYPTGGPPAEVYLHGDPNFLPEILLAYEAGYRLTPSPDVMLDLTGFYNQYRDLRTIEPGTTTFEPLPSPHVDVLEDWKNGMYGDTRGLEAAAVWNVTDAWKLNASASCLAMRLHLDPNSSDVGSVAQQDNEPGYQLMLQSQLHPTSSLEWDATVYQIDGRTGQHLPAYTRLDLGLAWRAFDLAELSLFGKNLLQGRHFEDNGIGSGVVPTQVQRSVTARVSVQF